MPVATATYLQKADTMYGLDLLSASFGNQYFSTDTTIRTPDDGMYHPSQGFISHNQATQTETMDTPTTAKVEVDSRTVQLSQPTVLQMAQPSTQQSGHSITQSASRLSEPVTLLNSGFHTSQQSENLSQTALNPLETSDSFSSTSYQSPIPQMTSASSSGDSSHASEANTSTVIALVIVALATTFIAFYILFWLYLHGKKRQTMIFSSKPRSLSDCETVTSINNLKSAENAVQRSQDRETRYWKNTSEVVHSSAKDSVEVLAQPAPAMTTTFQNRIASFIHHEWERAKSYGSKIVVFTSNKGGRTDFPTRSGTIRSHYGTNVPFTSSASSFESISPLDLQIPGWASLTASDRGETSIPQQAVLSRKPSPPISIKLIETCNEQQISRKPVSSRSSYRSVSAGSNPRSGSSSAHLTQGEISPSVYSTLQPIAPPLLPMNLYWRDIFHVEIDYQARSPTQLSIQEGEKVVLMQAFDNGWVSYPTTPRTIKKSSSDSRKQVSCYKMNGDGEEGLVPRAYLSSWPFDRTAVSTAGGSIAGGSKTASSSISTPNSVEQPRFYASDVSRQNSDAKLPL